jgi:hypothetical protein
MMARSMALGAAVLASLACQASESLELHRERLLPTDLEISGLLTGVPANQKRFVRWQDIRGLPSREIDMKDEFFEGTHRVRAVMLSDFLARLPRSSRADTVTVTCTDGYASVFQGDYIARWQPFIVVEINGLGPEEWPVEGMTFNPGPYVITTSNEIAPGVRDLLDESHKRPWGVSSMRVVSYEEEFRPFYTERWARVTAAAGRGRQIWINSCYSCHVGPGNQLGGSKSGRPFEVLQAHAQHNRAYFVNYVRNPQGQNSAAQMTAHPHYTDSQMSDLISFVIAQRERR